MSLCTSRSAPSLAETRREMIAALIGAVPRTSQTLGYQLLAHAFVEAYAEAMFETPPLDAEHWIAEHCSRHGARASAAGDLQHAAGALETRLTDMGFPDQCLVPLRGLLASDAAFSRVPAPGALALDERDADIAEFWALHGPAERSAAEHAKAVGDWSARLARRLSLSRREETFVRRCGLLHDIGGQENIEVAPGLHALGGERLLRRDPSLQEYASVVRSHHEKLDGSGGPDGLRGTAISLPVRIVSVADRFNELITAPVGKASLQPDKALDHLAEEAGASYDIRVVAALHDLLDPRSR